MIYAVCGGKGGTGKSTFSLLLAKQTGALLVDTDAENPNLHALTNQELGEKIDDIFSKKAVVVKEKCKKCGICADRCRFNAIFWSPGNYPIIMDELCEGCGLCQLVCPFGAIKMEKVKVGELYLTNGNPRILTATTDGGEAGQVIPTAIEKAKEISKDFILDCPAGIHCNMLHQMEEADEVYVVTEQSPLGLQALKETLQAARELGKIPKIVINKATGDLKEFEKTANEFGAKIVKVIPYSDKIAKAYANGNILEVLE